MEPRPLLKGVGSGQTREEDSLIDGALFSRNMSLRREKGESPHAFRGVYAQQIGPVIEAKTAQTSWVLEALSQTRRVWGSGLGHQCPL